MFDFTSVILEGRMITRKYRINGIVQGVGFRPFVHKLASDLNLSGWVLNDAEGVLLNIQGNSNILDVFIDRLLKEAPPLSKIENIILLSSCKSHEHNSEFRILSSNSSYSIKTLISPDYSICNECLEELFDENDRRYYYPFINCTNCGPRYTIIRNLPYDRINTTMSNFKLCPLCNSEYNFIADRRYHAQPNACHKCGPKVLLSNNSKNKKNIENIKHISSEIINGKIIAIKSLGGFHLVCDAHNRETVNLLRARKMRRFKALAIMTMDVKTVRKFAYVSDEDEKTLRSKERPIVLLDKKEYCSLDYVAPNNSKIGVMLPSTPLHYILLKEVNLDALIMTSGNLPDSPIIYENSEAIKELSAIADGFLLNDRDIYSFVDDSIVKNVKTKDSKSSKFFVIRRSRGYVPLPLKNDGEMKKILALGAELKNTIAISKEKNIFLSQHLGDLKNEISINRQIGCINHLLKIFNTDYDYIACDMHPSFSKGHYINGDNVPVIQIQHHHAHMASCMFENKVTSKVIGVIFDGTGYGIDGNIWGGEFLIGDLNDFERVGSVKPFKLLGGDKAIAEPYRVGLSLIFETFNDIDVSEIKKIFKFIDEFKLNTFYKMYENNINTFLTTSMGRLFDAVSSLLGICTNIEYEAQASVEMEAYLNNDMDIAASMPFCIITNDSKYEIDYRPLVKYILESISIISTEELCRKFHSTIVDMTVEMCKLIRMQYKINEVVLSGGVFQNDFLVVNTKCLLEENSFVVYVSSEIPCNDGGISIGQVVIANAKLSNTQFIH